MRNLLNVCHSPDKQHFLLIELYSSADWPPELCTWRPEGGTSCIYFFVEGVGVNIKSKVTVEIGRRGLWVFTQTYVICLACAALMAPVQEYPPVSWGCGHSQTLWTRLIWSFSTFLWPISSYWTRAFSYFLSPLLMYAMIVVGKKVIRHGIGLWAWTGKEGHIERQYTVNCKWENIERGSNEFIKFIVRKFICKEATLFKGKGCRHRNRAQEQWKNSNSNMAVDFIVQKCSTSAFMTDITMSRETKH